MDKTEIISSRQNVKVKNWRKLQSSKGRKQQKQYLIEGIHLVQEALLFKQTVLELMITPDFQVSVEWRSLKEHLPTVSTINRCRFIKSGIDFLKSRQEDKHLNTRKPHYKDNIIQNIGNIKT